MLRSRCRCRLRVTAVPSPTHHGLFSIILMLLTVKMEPPVTLSLFSAMLKVGEALLQASDPGLLSLFQSKISLLTTRSAESLLLSRNRMVLRLNRAGILATRWLRTFLKIKRLKMKKLNSMMKSTLSIIWTILKEMTKTTVNHSFLRKNNHNILISIGSARDLPHQALLQLY